MAISVAIAAVDESHLAHRVCRLAATRYRPAVAGHATFETFSVLTRLTGDARVDPETAGEILQLAFPERGWLSAVQYEALMAKLQRGQQWLRSDDHRRDAGRYAVADAPEHPRDRCRAPVCRRQWH